MKKKFPKQNFQKNQNCKKKQNKSKFKIKKYYYYINRLKILKKIKIARKKFKINENIK